MGVQFKFLLTNAFTSAIEKVSGFNIEKEDDKVKNYTMQEKLHIARFVSTLKKELELFQETLKPVQKEHNDKVSKGNLSGMDLDLLKIELQDKVTALTLSEAELPLLLDFNVISKNPALTATDISALEPVLKNLPIEESAA